MSKLSQLDLLKIEYFKQGMIKKLNQPKNLKKTHWDDTEIDYLLQRLVEEVDELSDAVEDNKMKRIVSECYDVANFAMMIASKTAEVMNDFEEAKP